MSRWDGFFSDPIDYSDIFDSVVVLVAHIAALFGITSYIFIKKDILS